MKINRFGKAEVLTAEEVNVLFTEGFVNPRDRALFGVCLYCACRINEACTLLTGDVFGKMGVRSKILFRYYNTKGKKETREILVHPDFIAVSVTPDCFPLQQSVCVSVLMSVFYLLFYPCFASV